MGISISKIATYLPSKAVSNEELSREFPEWSVDKIAEKTGIQNRHIASDDEFASTLGVRAAEKLLAEFDDEFVLKIDALIVVSQSPDYFLPGIASSIHLALNLRKSIPSIDLNQGCSGYVSGLGLAKGLIESGQAKRVLLITTDTYSKYLGQSDKSVRTIFGDGATATVVETSVTSSKDVNSFIYGTDGSGAQHLIVQYGGLKEPIHNSVEQQSLLHMNGPEVFNFTLQVAKQSVADILAKANLSMEGVDYFVFHQANAFMLRHLREKIGIPEAKFPILMADFGNTVSSTIPMALNKMMDATSMGGKKVLLLGFGVGLSWAGCLVDF